MSQETNQVLRSILEVIREQAIYLHRQHAWIVAIAETIEKNPDLASLLRQHPLYDQGHRLDIYKTELLLQKIDVLIQELRGGLT